MLVLQSSCRSASEMKVFLAGLVCAMVGVASGGSVAWPGAVPVSFSAYSSAVLPPQTRSIAYSSSQYINALPSSPIGYQPQFTYQLPQSSLFPSLTAYQPYQTIASAPYFPQSTFFYPQLSQTSPIAPSIPAIPAFPAIPAIPASPAIPAVPSPQQPTENPSSQPPQQPAGDEDTTVIDSAEFPQQQQDNQQTLTSDFSSQSDISSQSQGSAQSDISSQSQFSSQADFSSQPQSGLPSQSQTSYTDLSSQPQFNRPLYTPQYPSQGASQEAENMPPQSQQPAFPQFPQFPQLPQLPQFPQFPSFPSNPLFPQQTTTPPPSLPESDTGSKGLNDEDTVTVDSA